jgi:oxygen-independent coproporphyrinogen-3 oxidase
MDTDQNTNPVSIYIHIPFCQTKCPYCDFNSYETSGTEVQLREKGYVHALLKELSVASEKYQIAGREVRSIFFGGGTPSLLSGEAVFSLIEGVKERARVTSETEVTLEANPRSIQETFPEEKLASFYQAGINRISFGAQSFIQEKLDFLGRWHTPEDTFRSIEMARKKGFSNFNLDLMFGVKGEVLSTWESELFQAISLSPAHISTYMLTMEPGTVFGKRTKKGEVFITEDDTFVSLYEASQRILGDAGYDQYEISNFSKPGMTCFHNIVYWRNGEYIGLGAGAHSYMKQEGEYGVRWSNTPSPSLYVSRILSEGHATQIHDPLTREALLLEKISLGLRMLEGISVTDQNIEMIVPHKKIAFFLASGFLEIVDGYLRIPKVKLHLADSIVGEVCEIVDEG